MTFSEAAARTMQAARTAVPAWHENVSAHGPTPTVTRTHGDSGTRGLSQPGTRDRSPAEEAECGLPTPLPSLSTYCVPGPGHRPAEDPLLSLGLPQSVVTLGRVSLTVQCVSRGTGGPVELGGKAADRLWLRPWPGAQPWCGALLTQQCEPGGSSDSL